MGTEAPSPAPMSQPWQGSLVSVGWDVLGPCTQAQLETELLCIEALAGIPLLMN